MLLVKEAATAGSLANLGILSPPARLYLPPRHAPATPDDALCLLRPHGYGEEGWGGDARVISTSQQTVLLVHVEKASFEVI